jgi:uncharacterized protein YeaO (DUF488 family)
MFIKSDLLPIFIIRNISNSTLIGPYSGTKIHCKILAPSTELFKRKRNTEITIDEFKKLYALEIAEVNLEQILHEWELLAECSGAKGIVILGFGSMDEICHRSVLRSILNSSGLLNNRIEEILL